MNATQFMENAALLISISNSLSGTVLGLKKSTYFPSRLFKPMRYFRWHPLTGKNGFVAMLIHLVERNEMYMILANIYNIYCIVRFDYHLLI